MRGRGPFEVDSARVAARRFKWATGAWLGSLAAWALLVGAGVDVLAVPDDWVALAVLGSGALVELAICVAVALTAIEYLAWVRHAVGGNDR